MPHIPILKPAHASKEVKGVYEEFYRGMSFASPPNFIMTQGHSPWVARGTWEVVRNILVMGEIPRWTKEMMFVAISRDRKCRYCEAAHIACCRMLGVKPELLEQLVRDVDGLPDPKLRTLVLFALKCSRAPQSLTEEDYNRLREHGLKKSEIVEIIAMSAFAVYANIIADATAMDPDELFGTTKSGKSRLSLIGRIDVGSSRAQQHFDRSLQTPNFTKNFSRNISRWILLNFAQAFSASL